MPPAVPAARGRFVSTSEQARHFHPECPRELFERAQRRVLARRFQSGEIASADTGPLGELLLAHAAALPPVFQPSCHRRSRSHFVPYQAQLVKAETLYIGGYRDSGPPRDRRSWWRQRTPSRHVRRISEHRGQHHGAGGSQSKALTFHD